MAKHPERLVVRWQDQSWSAVRDTNGSLTFDSGATVSTEALGGGAYRVEFDGRTLLAFVVTDGDRRTVFLEGDVYELELGRDAGSRRARATHESLSAPMPGNVVQVLVRPGDNVKTGDTLLVLEAMKMEWPVKAPHDGRVRSVNAAEGDRVEGGTPLVELE